jgi:hypothetical protein
MYRIYQKELAPAPLARILMTVPGDSLVWKGTICRMGVVRLLLVRGSLLRCLALDVHRDLLCDRDRSGKRGRRRALS